MALVLAAGLFVFAGIGLFRGPRDSGPTAVPAPSASVLLGPGAGGGSITVLQNRLRTNPQDWRGFATLGLSYIAEARVTADPSYYPKAEGVLRESLRLRGEGNFEALVGLGALSLARHDFADALEYGERARELNPYNGDVYGVIGDALLELGRYDEAFRAFQTMVDTRPNLSSYARVSYARELRGDVEGAFAAMEAALGSAGTPTDAAWASYHVGELSFSIGDLRRAAAAYRRGIQLAPGFVPNRAGLAKVAWARGDLERAIDGFVWVTQRYPLPEYVIALGDLYAASGRRSLAERQFDLVRAMQELFRANGVNVDLELALFEADRGDPAEAVGAARGEWGRRESIHVADALGWALYRDGRAEEAAPYADRALALGTRNALFFFHSGMIRLRLGDEERARELLREALDLNPYFSIRWTPVAERTLAKLEASR